MWGDGHSDDSGLAPFESHGTFACWLNWNHGADEGTTRKRSTSAALVIPAIGRFVSIAFSMQGLPAQVARHPTGHACTFCGREAADGVPIAADFGTCDGASVGEPMSVY